MGIGLPTASVGLLSQIYDPGLAIALVVFPSMIANAWQLLRAGEALRAFNDYRVIAVTLVVVLWFTTYLTAAVSQETLLLIVGCAVVLFSLNSLFLAPPRIPDRLDRPAQFVAGIGSGLLGGLTAIWAPPMVTYLIARGVEKDEFVRVTGLLIFLGTLPLCAGLWRAGLFTGAHAGISAAMVGPALAGFQVGEAIRRRIDASRFQTVLLVVFLLMGLNIIRRGLF